MFYSKVDLRATVRKSFKEYFYFILYVFKLISTFPKGVFGNYFKFKGLKDTFLGFI